MSWKMATCFGRGHWGLALFFQPWMCSHTQKSWKNKPKTAATNAAASHFKR